MDYLTWLLTRYPLMSPDGGDGNGGGDGGDVKLPTTAAELRTLLDAESAKTRRALEATQKTAIEDAVKAALEKQAEEAQKAAKLKAEEEAGNFAPIRKQLEDDLEAARKEASDAKADADARGAKLTKAQQLLKDRLDERVKALDHEKLKAVKDDYLAKFPDDSADLLDRLDYLDHPGVKAAVDSVAGQSSAHRDALRGAAGTIPNAQGPLTDEQRVAQEKQALAQSGRYTKF